MKMKKILAMLLVGAMALTALAGCGGGAASAPAASAPAASADEGGYKVALIQQHQTNAFQIAVTEAAATTVVTNNATRPSRAEGVLSVPYVKELFARSSTIPEELRPVLLGCDC